MAGPDATARPPSAPLSEGERNIEARVGRIRQVTTVARDSPIGGQSEPGRPSSPEDATEGPSVITPARVMASSGAPRQEASPVIGAQIAPTPILVVALVTHRQVVGAPVRAIDGVTFRRIGGRLGIVIRPAGVTMVDVPPRPPVPTTSPFLATGPGVAW